MSSLTRSWGLRTRAAALALLCTAALSFGAPVDRASNSIGQDLGPWMGGPWRLELAEGRRTLYRYDEIVFVEVERQEGERLIIEHQEGAAALRTTVLEKGVPVQMSEGVQSTLFQYDTEGRLQLIASLSDGAVHRVEAYAYHRDGGHDLSAVVALGAKETLRTLSRDRDDRIYVYTIEGRGESFTKTQAGVEIIQQWGEGTVGHKTLLRGSDDGGYTLTKGDHVDRYDGSGLLVETIDGEEVTTYWYTEHQRLDQAVHHGAGGRVIVTYYEKEQAVRSEERVDGALAKRTRYLPDGGRVETLYINDKPYCDVTYGPDAIRVLAIAYY